MLSGEVDSLKFRKVASRIFEGLILRLDPLLGKNYPYTLVNYYNIAELIIHYPRYNLLSIGKTIRYLWICIDITAELDRVDTYARVYIRPKSPPMIRSRFFYSTEFSGVKSILLANPDWDAWVAMGVGRLIRQFENNEPIRLEY